MKKHTPLHTDVEEYYNIINNNFTVNVLFAGREHCTPINRVESVREHFLMHYVLGGSGTVYSGGETHRLTKGGWFVFFPGQRAGYSPDENDPWHYAWAGFNGREAASILASAGIISGSSVFSLPYRPEIAALFHEMIDTLKKKRSGFSVTTEGIFLKILGELIAQNGAAAAEIAVPVKERSKEYVEKAIEFINTNCTQRISAADIAGYAGLDAAYLTRLFKRHTGSSMHDYLISVRIDRAKLLLKNTQYTVNEVAQSVGYDDYFTFAKRFKKMTRVTPSVFRDRMFY